MKNRRHKPLYKKFVSLRANVQFRKRLYDLKFKKQKWDKLIFQLKRTQNKRRKNFKAYDLNSYHLPKFYNPFKRKHKNILQNKQRISLFYGNLLVNYLKSQADLTKKSRKKALNKMTNPNFFFLSLMEKRLDVVLHRVHFAPSVKNAQQLILHNHVKVNGTIAAIKSLTLRRGDKIEICDTAKPSVYLNLSNSFFWPLPPKCLHVNYNTFEIIYNDDVEFQNLAILFPFFPDVHSLLRNLL